MYTQQRNYTEYYYFLGRWYDYRGWWRLYCTHVSVWWRNTFYMSVLTTNATVSSERRPVLEMVHVLILWSVVLELRLLDSGLEGKVFIVWQLISVLLMDICCSFSYWVKRFWRGITERAKRGHLVRGWSHLYVLFILWVQLLWWRQGNARTRVNHPFIIVPWMLRWAWTRHSMASNRRNLVMTVSTPWNEGSVSTATICAFWSTGSIVIL